RWLRNDDRAAAPRRPVANIPGRACECSPISGFLRRGICLLGHLQRCLDPLHPFASHVVRMLGNRPIRQTRRLLALLYEGSAHASLQTLFVNQSPQASVVPLALWRAVSGGRLPQSEWFHDTSSDRHFVRIAVPDLPTLL